MIEHQYEDVVAKLSRMNPNAFTEDVLEILRGSPGSLSVREVTEKLIRSAMTNPRQPYIDEIQQMRDMVDVTLYSLMVSGRAMKKPSPAGVEVYYPVCRTQLIEHRVAHMRSIVNGFEVRPIGLITDDPTIMIQAPLSVIYSALMESATSIDE